MALEEVLNGGMGEPTGGDDVRQWRAGDTPDAAALGEVGLQEGPVLAAELGERMQTFHHARALGPATTHTSGECDDGQLAVAESSETTLAKIRAR